MNNILPHVLTTTIGVLMVTVIKKNLLPSNAVPRLALPPNSPGALGEQSLLPADPQGNTQRGVREKISPLQS